MQLESVIGDMKTGVYSPCPLATIRAFAKVVLTDVVVRVSEDVRSGVSEISADVKAAKSFIL